MATALAKLSKVESLPEYKSREARWRKLRGEYEEIDTRLTQTREDDAQRYQRDVATALGAGKPIPPRPPSLLEGPLGADVQRWQTLRQAAGEAQRLLMEFRQEETARALVATLPARRALAVAFAEAIEASAA